MAKRTSLEKRVRPEEDPKTWKTNIPPLSRLSSKEKVSLFKYLAVMIDAGIPLEKALTTIHGQTRSTLMHRVLHIIINDVTSGEFLSTSLRKMPQLFEGMLTGLVEAGENSGTLSASLFRISQNLEKSQELNGKIRTALLYPAIVVLATGGITAYLLFVLLPQITPLFSSLDIELPLTTQIVMGLSSFAIAHWVAILGGFVLSVILFIVLYKTVKPFRRVMHLISLHIPIFGNLLRKVQVAQFTRVVGTMLKSGITVVEAFKIAGDGLSNLVYREILAEIVIGLQEGQTISSHFNAHRSLFPPLVTQMVSVGEETGKLDESFLFIAEFSEREVDEGTKSLTAVLEPLLMLVIGTIVGFVAIAIISPIYKLTGGISE